MKTYRAITDLLVESGVDTVFTLQSDGNMRMLAHMHGERAEDVRLIKARHEGSAVAMADGYARAGADLSVCTIGRGPAVAQSGTSLVTTGRRGSNLLVLVPETATDRDFDVKGFDQEAYLKDTIGDVISVRDPGRVIPRLGEGIRRVNAGDGPVAVQIARNVFEGDLEFTGEDPPPFDPVGADAAESRVHPDPAAVEAAVDRYLDSDATKAPVVLAGRGAMRSGAREAIEALAERMNALLATSLRGRGYFDDHPYHLGFVGHYGGNLTNELVMESDFVLAVGCSLNPYTTDEGHLFTGEATVVHVDADPGAIGRFEPIDLGIVGDATVTVEAIHEELEARGIDRRGAFWTDRLRDRIADAPAFAEREFPDRPGTIDPRELLTTLDRLLPDDRIVVSDTGHHTRWVLDALETPAPEDLVWPSEFGSIGLGLPTGVGAALAVEDRTCVTVCGDAGFMMADHAVETAARHGVSMVIVVVNDAALGTEYHSLDRYGDHADVSVIETPDLAAMAEAMGAEGATVRSAADLDGLADRLGRKPDGPFVLDCRVNRDVVHRSKL